MKLPIPCMLCFQELGHPTNEFSILEFRDDGQYEMCCSRGHKSVTVLQQQKFEVLFDIGANAIIDGYYREAISSFTSSLERFYEFCIKVFCEKQEIDEDTYTNAWKQISNQSERQLGAFILLWVNELGEVPKLLSNNDTKFRNEVIHKGKIPSKNEAIKYGNSILEITRPKINQLRTEYADEISKVTFMHIRNCSELTDDQLPGGTMSISTILGRPFVEEKLNNQSLEDALSELQKKREVMSNI